MLSRVFSFVMERFNRAGRRQAPAIPDVGAEFQHQEHEDNASPVGLGEPHFLAPHTPSPHYERDDSLALARITPPHYERDDVLIPFSGPQEPLVSGSCNQQDLSVSGGVPASTPHLEAPVFIGFHETPASSLRLRPGLQVMAARLSEFFRSPILSRDDYADLFLMYVGEDIDARVPQGKIRGYQNTFARPFDVIFHCLHDLLEAARLRRPRYSEDDLSAYINWFLTHDSGYICKSVADIARGAPYFGKVIPGNFPDYVAPNTNVFTPCISGSPPEPSGADAVRELFSVLPDLDFLDDVVDSYADLDCPSSDQEYPGFSYSNVIQKPIRAAWIEYFGRLEVQSIVCWALVFLFVGTSVGLIVGHLMFGPQPQYNRDGYRSLYGALDSEVARDAQPSGSEIAILYRRVASQHGEPGVDYTCPNRPWLDVSAKPESLNQLSGMCNFG